MHPPIFVRELSVAERAQFEAGLRAASAFTMRRAQIVLASAAGRRPRAIAQDLRCAAVQTVRNAIRAFNTAGVASLAAARRRARRAPPRCWARPSGRGCGRSCTSRRVLSVMPGALGRSIFWRGWRTRKG